jgi:hypothetical protein
MVKSPPHTRPYEHGRTDSGLGSIAWNWQDEDMARAKIPPFRLIVVDHDRKVFNGIPPMVDDTGYIDRVTREQGKRRTVNCFRIGEGTREELAASYSAETASLLPAADSAQAAAAA